MSAVESPASDSPASDVSAGWPSGGLDVDGLTFDRAVVGTFPGREITWEIGLYRLTVILTVLMICISA